MQSVLQPELLVAMVATILAGIVRGFSGFGAAMMQAPVFALLFAPTQAVAIMTGLGTLASLQLLRGVARHVDWRQIVPITLAALVTVPVGSLLLVALAPELMRRGISGMVLVLVLVLMTGWRYPGRRGPWAAAGAGALSGVINGATGVGGPPVVLYLLAGPDSARTNRANLICYFTFLGAATWASLVWHGVITLETIWRTLALWPVQIVSLWFGSWLFTRVNDALYRKLALVVLLAVALFGLFYRR
jgi:hypothetical protein